MTNTSTISGKKRGKDSAPPDPKKLQKTLQIKDDEAEVGSSTNVQKLDSIVVSKGKGKAPVQRKEKKVVDSPVCKDKSTVSQPRNKSSNNKEKKKVSNNKGKKKVNEEEEEDEEEVKDLEIPEEELSKEKDDVEEDEDEDELVAETYDAAAARKIDRKISRKDVKSVCRLTGRPVLKDEARKRWPRSYEVMEGGVDCFQHYTSAQVDGVDFELNDCCYIKAAEGESDYIGRIVEFFETAKKKPYISVKWFFRPIDTVIGKEAHSELVDAELMNAKLVFASNSSDVNPLDCIVSKIAVVQSSPEDVPECDFFYNMSYSEDLHTFENLPIGDEQDVASTSSSIWSKCSSNVAKGACDSQDVMTLLDLYAGCGGMSTGLCMGAAANNVNLVARWAVDYNKDACLSLRHNHPETEVRNEKAEDFLELLKKWEELCQPLILLRTPFSKTKIPIERNGKDGSEEDPKMCPADDNGEYEVDKLIDICYGDPNETGKAKALYYKVVWKGWGSDHDSWEPASDLVKCEESINDFVTLGYKSNILPLPGTVDVVCGGPPCQGISGFNRFRNVDNPLEDDKNFQLGVFMDIVKFLRPKFTLMENVVDILKLKDGFLGRYAVGRLVAMQYQVRLGLLVAGSYGLPQYRQRLFLWGAIPSETLPQFPLPTHKVISRGYTPKAFKGNLVAEKDDNKLLKALVLEDAITDLPPISTHETRDEMEYVERPKTKFQRMIRLSKWELMGSAPPQPMQSVIPKLYDHLPLKLSPDDNHRVCRIPKEKGANYRDLPGVIVDAVTNVASLDLDNRVFIESGKPLVPDYAVKFVKGKSRKPFGRLWPDETVSTVVTRAEPHNQAILHPHQDRVMSVRENARFQGFPDFYKFIGTVKQRYVQVGNAVAVPVGKALGYTLGNAVHKISDGGQVVELPPSFSG